MLSIYLVIQFSINVWQITFFFFFFSLGEKYLSVLLLLWYVGDILESTSLRGEVTWVKGNFLWPSPMSCIFFSLQRFAGNFSIGPPDFHRGTVIHGCFSNLVFFGGKMLENSYSAIFTMCLSLQALESGSAFWGENQELGAKVLYYSVLRHCTLFMGLLKSLSGQWHVPVYGIWSWSKQKCAIFWFVFVTV